jgi:hypothetical protein
LMTHVIHAKRPASAGLFAFWRPHSACCQGGLCGRSAVGSGDCPPEAGARFSRLVLQGRRIVWTSAGLTTHPSVRNMLDRPERNVPFCVGSMGAALPSACRRCQARTCVPPRYLAGHDPAPLAERTGAGPGHLPERRKLILANLSTCQFQNTPCLVQMAPSRSKRLRRRGTRP